jgi:phosphoglycolate phosphatase-like HAD superfamily hydrolase
MDLSTIKVCIFDVNGVLIDSNSANSQAMAQAFTDCPMLQRRISELYLKLTGIDRGSKIRAIQEQVIKKPFRVNEFELRWGKVKEQTLLSMLKAPILPGVKEVLAELARRNITRVALSNTPAVELEMILAAHGLKSLLDIIRGGGDWPKSESLARFIGEFKFETDKCLFVGDGKGDLAAARYAGVAFVGIDPGTGEFDGEDGFDGPYENLADWYQKIGGLSDQL